MSSFILLSCSSSKAVEGKKCPKIYKNDFAKISNEEYKTIYKNDTIAYNELRYECVFNPFYIQKGMYDRFGKWDKEIYPSNRKQPILMWKNVDLFQNGKNYTVMANSFEGEERGIYASVMVFDSHEVDLLSDSSSEKEILKKYFSDLIKSNDPKKEGFNKAYRENVNPNFGTTRRKVEIK